MCYSLVHLLLWMKYLEAVDCWSDQRRHLWDRARSAAETTEQATMNWKHALSSVLSWIFTAQGGKRKYFCMARYWWQDAFSPIWLIVCQCCTSLGENPLAFLRTQPQFLHMRQAIQQNPAMLPALLQQLGRENPQLLQVTHSIYSHRELYTCTHEINVKCLVFINNPASHFYGMLFATRHTQLHLEEVLFIHLMDRSIVTSFRS